MKVMCGKYFLLIFDRNALMKCQYEQQDLGNRRDRASEIYFFILQGKLCPQQFHSSNKRGKNGHHP